MAEEKHHHHLFHRKKDEDKPFTSDVSSETGSAYSHNSVSFSHNGACFFGSTSHVSMNTADFKETTQKHKAEKDPEHVRKIGAAATVPAREFALDKHQKKKEPKSEEKEAHGKKHRHGKKLHHAKKLIPLCLKALLMLL